MGSRPTLVASIVVACLVAACASTPPASVPEPPASTPAPRLHAPTDTNVGVQAPAAAAIEPCPTMERVGWEPRKISPMPIAGASLACGGATCSDAAPLCCEGIHGGCEGPTKCVARAADCYPTARVLACVRARDCPEPTRCYVLPAFGTACAASSDGISVETCASDDECRKPARCLPHPDVPSVRLCHE